jgi:hypothetical protein
VHCDLDFGARAGVPAGIRTTDGGVGGHDVYFSLGGWCMVSPAEERLLQG